MTPPDSADHEPIQGPRLRLRPITPDDSPTLDRWLNDPAVVAAFGRPPADVAEAGGDDGESAGLACWVFIIEDDGRPVGGIQYFHDRPSAPWSVGIDIFIGEPEARDRGLGTEALRTLLQYLFETTRVNRVTICPEPSNRRAVRAYEKAGFRLDGVLRRHMKIDGRWVDIAFMSLLDDEWPSAKASWRPPVDSR